MLQHHADTIERVREHFAGDPAVDAVFLGGSIAHGYATAKSDVDIVIVVGDGEYRRREAAGDLLFFSRELAAWPEGYVDGKLVDRATISLVAERGNEATRYAYADLRPILCRDEAILALVEAAGRYPEESRERNALAFYQHMRAWMWFFHEARSKEDAFYLEAYAVAQFVLYASRAVLAHNGRLYPFHKWLTAEVGRCERKPAALLEDFRELLERRSPAVIERVCAGVKALKDWGVGDWDWPKDFTRDVENPWKTQEPYISDR